MDNVNKSVAMPDTELALLIDRFMRRIHFGLQEKAAGFDKQNVGPSGGIILLTITELGCPSLHELTEKVARDKSQMTRVIRSMEAKGLVKRQPSPTDGRVTLVSLTSAGEDVVSQIQKAVAETIDEVLGPISQADKERFENILQRALR